MKTGWWYRASTEERLAQIDAGIELGMTSKQVAMNCGCVTSGPMSKGHETLWAFATAHGRHFPHKYGIRSTEAKKLRSRLRPKRLAEAKDAYLAGEAVDFWGVQ